MATVPSSARDALTGAIIAAGRGTRMNGAYRGMPKTLLPVGGRPVLAHQLDAMRTLGISRVLVVVGCGKERVRDYLEAVRPGPGTIETIEQPSASGSGDALLCLAPHVTGPFALFLGDIFFVPDHPSLLVAPVLDESSDAVVATADERDAARFHRNFRVVLGTGDRVIGVVEKPPMGETGLKGCGMYAFTPAIFDALARTPRAVTGELGITDAIQTLIDGGATVRAARVSTCDVNLTTPADLAWCEARLAGRARVS